jgi:DNA-binding MarR family transcriptional regulator
MKYREKIAEKLYKMTALLSWETEIVWDYGAGIPLYHSEIHLLKIIREHEGAKASEIAAYMNITNGAVSQGTKKLLDKGLVEDYKLPGNRKEVFFRLTPLGEKAYHGHEKHHSKIEAPFLGFLADLSEKELQTINNFLEAAMQGIEKAKKEREKGK